MSGWRNRVVAGLLAIFGAAGARADQVALYLPPGHYLGCCVREIGSDGPWLYTPHISAANCGNLVAEPRSTAWQLSAGSLGGFEEVGERVLSAASVPYGGGLRRPARVATSFQAGVGALYRHDARFALDLGLFAGSGAVTQATLPLGGVATTSTANVRFLGASLFGRLYPMGNDSRLQPWLSAGMRGLVLRPESGSQTVGSRRAPLSHSDLATAGSADFASGLGVDLRAGPRLTLTAAGDYGFRTGWRASLTAVLPISGRTDRVPVRGEPGNPYAVAGVFHTRALDRVLDEIRKAAASSPGRRHTPEELFALVESSTRSFLREEGFGIAGADPFPAARERARRGEHLDPTALPELERLSPAERGYVREAIGLVDAAPETGDLEEPFRRLGERAFADLGPGGARALVAIAIAGSSAEYWRRSRGEWSEAIRGYVGVDPRKPPEPPALKWFHWGQVGGVDLGSGIVGAVDGGVVGGLVGAVVGSAFDAVGQVLTHWIFG